MTTNNAVLHDVDGENDDNITCLPPSPLPPQRPRRVLEPRPCERFLTAYERLSYERHGGYERLSYELASDRRCLREITLGKRVGFYQLRNQIGSGNFSTVKLGVHILTRGQ